MLSSVLSSIMYTFTFLALVAIDYFLGNGFVDILQKILCKVICYIRKSLKEEEKKAHIITKSEEDAVNVPILVTEIMFLALTIVILNKYKQRHRKDRFDDVLQGSREALRQTNEILDKWRLRRMNMHLQEEYSYLDEEPQEISPYKLEVPILHMAIIDTFGATRNQPESGDAGDLTSFTDSTILSMTSLLDDDPETLIDDSDERIEEINTPTNRVLWNVVEEDGNKLDD